MHYGICASMNFIAKITFTNIIYVSSFFITYFDLDRVSRLSSWIKYCHGIHYEFICAYKWPFERRAVLKHYRDKGNEAYVFDKFHLVELIWQYNGPRFNRKSSTRSAARVEGAARKRSPRRTHNRKRHGDPPPSGAYPSADRRKYAATFHSLPRFTNTQASRNVLAGRMRPLASTALLSWPYVLYSATSGARNDRSTSSSWV